MTHQRVFLTACRLLKDLGMSLVSRSWKQVTTSQANIAFSSGTSHIKFLFITIFAALGGDTASNAFRGLQHGFSFILHQLNVKFDDKISRTACTQWRLITFWQHFSRGSSQGRLYFRLQESANVGCIPAAASAKRYRISSPPL
jgi:hypothetical protein